LSSRAAIASRAALFLPGDSESLMRFFDQHPALTTPALRAVPAPAPRSARPDDATLAAHMARTRYGQFTLTDAIRPGWQLDIVPRAGYRHDAWVDPQGGGRLPALVAAASREDLFETFLDLLAPLGDTVDVVLESSHAEGVDRVEHVRDGIERLVLESVLWEYEDLLLHDGCTGIAVMHPELSMEVQLDEHKLIVAYAPSRVPFERVLRERGLERDDRLRFISQAEHLHTSHERFTRLFADLAGRIGAG
jgi:hypothetical protein